MSDDVRTAIVKPTAIDPGLLHKILRQAQKENRQVTLYTHFHMFTGAVSLIEQNVVVLKDRTDQEWHHWVIPTLIYAVSVLPEGIELKWGSDDVQV